VAGLNIVLAMRATNRQRRSSIFSCLASKQPGSNGALRVGYMQRLAYSDCSLFASCSSEFSLVCCLFTLPRLKAAFEGFSVAATYMRRDVVQLEFPTTAEAMRVQFLRPPTSVRRWRFGAKRNGRMAPEILA